MTVAATKRPSSHMSEAEKVQAVLTAVRAVFERLHAIAEQDAALQAGLCELARSFLALANEPRAEAAPPPLVSEAVAPPTGSVDPALTNGHIVPPTLPAPELASEAGNGVAIPPGPSAVELAAQLFKKTSAKGTIELPSRHSAAPITEADLAVIEIRCKLKAEGSRWAAQRRRRLEAGADFHVEIDPRDRDLIGRARLLPDCFLWMCHRNAPVPADPVQYDHLAGCFDAVGYAANLLAQAAQLTTPLDLFQQAMYLGAEAQSALRMAVAEIGGNPDGDQLKLFIWIRETAAIRGIWIERYMRQDDTADATAWADLLERLHALEEKFLGLKGRDKRVKKLLNKVRYHCKRIQDQVGENVTDDWHTIMQSVETLVQDGVPASNVEIRELLLPMIEQFPENVEPTKGFQLVIRELDRVLAESQPRDEPQEQAEPSAEVRKTAELLAGRAVVLIGGDRRPPAARALLKAFQLSELYWIEGHDQSYLSFEPQVANPDVAVILLAIRWSRHGFSEVKELCDKHGKPLVRLPGGYNPNQVAYNILTQVGERLAQQVIAESAR
jgi:hypothetical protein